MSFSLIIRRLGLTLVIATALELVFASFTNPDVFPWSFLLFWTALFFGWPYLNRKLNFNFPKAAAPRPSRRTDWPRTLGTGTLAFASSLGLAAVSHPEFFGLCFPFLWFVLYYAWPLLKRLPYLGFSSKTSTAPERPLWLRLIRGTFAWAGGIALALVAIGSVALTPLTFSHIRAQRVHDSVHVGMTVEQVLHATKDSDIFWASSDFPHEGSIDPDNLPVITLSRTQEGVYHTHDSATNRDLQLSEPDAIEQLHEKLHDGSHWTFHYTYTNLTPQHVSFSVVFGSDERVTEVKPVYGWD